MVTSDSLRLLIIEDDVIDRKLLERLLAQSSLGTCQVRHADRLATALDLLKEHVFDLVLLDLGLPDSQGMDSVSRVQRHVPHVPVIVLSGLDDEGMATQAVKMGVQDYLIKGQVDATLLMRAVRYALERKKAERQLQATELRYRTIFENSAVAIMMVDEEERLVSWNQFMERLLGMDEQQLRGRHVQTLYPQEEWQKVRALSIRRKGMRHHLETRMICGTGKIIDVDISLSVVHDSDGGISGSIGVIRDITERKTAEETLRHHVQEIERFNRLAIARELRVVELKQRINELARASDRPLPYRTLGEDGWPEEDRDASTEPADIEAPEDQPRDYTLADLLNRHQMQQLMDSYCDVLGVSSAIVDPEGNVFVQARWQPLCKDFHRANDRTCVRCLESDTVLAGQLEEGECFSLYQCRNGLMDAASPIVIGGRHVGSVFIGQFLLGPPDVEAFRRQAREFGFEETAYLEALARVPVLARERLPDILRYLTASAQLLAEMGLERIQGKAHETDLLHWAEELNRTNQALRQQREAALSLAEDANEARATAERVQEALLLKDSAVNSAASGIVFVGLDGRLTFVNPSALRMWGYDRESQVLGRPISTFLAAPDEGEAACRSAMENGVWNGELVARKGDGSDFVVQVSGSVVQDGNGKPLCLMVSLVDITESRRIHEILDRKQKNLEAIFDATPLGMLLVDDRMEVTRANDVIRQMSGKGYADIIGRDACQALNCTRAAHLADGPHAGHSDGCCVLRDVVDKALTSNESVRGVEMQPALGDEDKECPWFAISVEPVNIDGARHALITMNDITHRKQAEAELQNTLELKAQFISTVSHELRTPLTSMKEAIIIVREGVAGKINKDQTHFLDIAKRNSDRLARMIDNVLDFQRLNSGRMKFHMQENDVAATVNDVYNTMRPSAAKTGVNLAVDLQSDLPPAVYDSDRILQVLINLASNAIKFTPGGGRVLLSASRREEYLVFQVSDTGYGIPKEDLAKIFDQFYRVHRPGKEIKGTGLGLAIVSKIVAAHGGRIEVESELEKGTTFTVFLPLSPRSTPVGEADRIDRSLENVLAGN